MPPKRIIYIQILILIQLISEVFDGFALFYIFVQRILKGPQFTIPWFY